VVPYYSANYITNHKGNTPLHILFHFSDDKNDSFYEPEDMKNDVLWKLTHMWPDALRLPNNRGRTQFHEACHTHNKSLIQILLSHHPMVVDLTYHGEDIDVTTTVTSMRWLLYRLDSNAVDHDGNTPLHLVINGFILSKNMKEDSDCLLTIIKVLLNHPWISTTHLNSENKHAMDLEQELLRVSKQLRIVVTLLQNFAVERRWMAYRYIYIADSKYH
jgi:hypothetical protein